MKVTKDADKRTAEEFLIEMDAAYASTKPSVPMSDRHNEMMITLSFAFMTTPECIIGEEIKDDGNRKLAEMYRQAQAAKIFVERLTKAGDKKITYAAAFFICAEMQSPGDAVLMAHYVKSMYKGEVVTLNSAAMHIFPNGFFSRMQLEAFWKIQKRLGYRPDNWLDYAEAWNEEKNKGETINSI